MCKGTQAPIERACAVKRTIFGSRNFSVFKTSYLLGLATVTGLLVIAVAGCGGGETAASKVPDMVIRDYVAKHETMVDASLASLYIKTEQDKVMNRINSMIATRTAEGTLEGLQEATFDFSGLTVDVVGEKEDYINDEIKKFMKIAIKGTFIMKVQGSEEEIAAEETLILEMEGNEWKVTETINPWA